MAYFDKRKFPFVAAFAALRPEERVEIVRTNKAKGFVAAVHALVIHAPQVIQSQD